MPRRFAVQFVRFYCRVAVTHFVSYVVVGAVSYMLIMRYCLPRVPAEAGLREITSAHVQMWLWPAQLVRALVLAASLYPLRETILRAGRLGGLLVAGLMIGIGCLGGFNGLIENLIFYHNVSLYLYYIHIPEILGQTLVFGYSLAWMERMASRPQLQTLCLTAASR